MTIYAFIIKIFIKSKSNQGHILPIDLDRINFESDNNIDEGETDTVSYVRRLAWSGKFKKCKAIKK